MSGLFDISYFQKQIVRLTRHFSPRRKPSRAYSVFIEDARRRIRPVQLRNVRTHQRPLCLRLCFSWRRAKRTSASAFLRAERAWRRSSLAASLAEAREGIALHLLAHVSLATFGVLGRRGNLDTRGAARKKTACARITRRRDWSAAALCRAAV